MCGAGAAPKCRRSTGAKALAGSWYAFTSHRQAELTRQPHVACRRILVDSERHLLGGLAHLSAHNTYVGKVRLQETDVDRHRGKHVLLCRREVDTRGT